MAGRNGRDGEGKGGSERGMGPEGRGGRCVGGEGKAKEVLYRV